jgi:hypothetical protein
MDNKEQNEIFISTDAAVIISMLCQFMPNLFNCILDLSGSDIKNQNYYHNLPFNLLTPEQIKEALENDPCLLERALSSLAILQASLITTYDNLEQIEEAKSDISKLILSLLESSAQAETEKQEFTSEHEDYSDDDEEF